MQNEKLNPAIYIDRETQRIEDGEDNCGKEDLNLH